MMNHFLTDDVFNEGITNYLNAKKYGDAEQRDLWSALTEAARKHGAFDADVGVVMDSWTLQTGFPVVTIVRDYKKNEISFKQVLVNIFKYLCCYKNKTLNFRTFLMSNSLSIIHSRKRACLIFTRNCLKLLKM